MKQIVEPIEIHPAAARRWLAIAILVMLGLFLVVFSVTGENPGLLGLLVFLLGAAIVYLAYRLYRATEFGLAFDGHSLSDTHGDLLVTLDDIEKVDRGAFAFKPANGFVITTRIAQSRRWKPGLWWRYGKRIGVGGVLSPAHAKAFADQMSIALTLKSQESDFG